jgi:hypothetical protein
MEWLETAFREFASIFVPQNGISSSFLLHGRVRNGIARVASIFVPQNGILSCFLSPGNVWNVIQRVFCSMKYPFVPSIPSSVVNFLSEISLIFVSKGKHALHATHRKKNTKGEERRGGGAEWIQ